MWSEGLLIEERLKYLDNLVSMSKYVKQRKALEAKFLSFLLENGKNNIFDTTPTDIRRFLVSRDKWGKTVIHLLTCVNMVTQENSCSCPHRLAVGTVKSLLGKLSTIFESHGKSGPWLVAEQLGKGNPVESEEVKQYVQAIQKEQSMAHVEVKQAIPMFIDKLAKISQYILSFLERSDLKPVDIFIALRDKAFFLLQ